jgi:V/A-type H+-transporting ATPase subunit D
MIKFQYNRTFLLQLDKELKIRENALPTLVAKESSLRLEVKKAHDEISALKSRIELEMSSLSSTFPLWNEFPEQLIKISGIDIFNKKTAGVKIPVFREIKFAVENYSLFGSPAWIPSGIEILKSLSRLKVMVRIAEKKVEILEHARKKTTQKVNLYEKVQIPGYREAIRKVKQFLENEDNLAKSSQKILKEKIARRETVI